ncbi:MAG TPA: proton-translocating transhydrogenase family protein, partial [Gemmatimonadales bacterium]|nr:proton-translocating transhydrogenase family protein [Gemmatimonadales bacterium]
MHATSDLWSQIFVFVLATFIGLGVIRRVSRLLYTPLMSLTNAISAIAVVGAILVAATARAM